MSESRHLLSSERVHYQTIQSSTSPTPTLQTNERQSHSKRRTLIRCIEDLFDKYSTSVYLENKGSVARDHLANERTFLAWMRTSLSTISVGVAITQLFRLDKSVAHDPNVVTWGRPTGMVFIILGIAFLAFAFLRFFHAQVAMMNGYFPASRGIILVTSSATLTALSALFIIILQKS